MKVLIIADTLTDLNPSSDTGLSLAREAIRRGYDLYWSTPEEIIVEAKTVVIFATKVSECPEESLPTRTEDNIRLVISDLDSLWIRKDPPFDSSYLSMCWKLRLLHEELQILNPIETLLSFHEKMIPIFAAKAGAFPAEFVLDSYIGKCKELAKLPSVQEKLGRPYIIKPWLGHGGEGIRTMEKNLSSTKDADDIIAQKLIQDIAEVGDRRVLFIDGEYVGDFVRFPKKGSIIANLAQGGTAEIREPDSELRSLFDKLGSYLKSQSIFLAGADFIGNYLTEVNITAPTGFETVRKLTGKNLAEIYVSKAEVLSLA